MHKGSNSSAQKLKSRMKRKHQKRKVAQREMFGVRKLNNKNAFEKLFHDKFKEGWVFRGHADFDWLLESNLERYCRDFDFSNAAIIENNFLREFYRTIGAYVPELKVANSTQSLLALMQHHGTPTRLLDWSYSPYIASFFALEAATGDAAVWALNTNWLETEAIRVCKTHAPHFLPPGFSARDFPDPKAYDINRDDETFHNLYIQYLRLRAWPPVSFMYTVNPPVLNTRLAVQQGLFTAVGDVTKSLECNLQLYENVKDNIVKIIISKDVGREMLKDLHRMGISRASLYPGLDGFASSLKTRAHALRSNLTRQKWPMEP